jgi:hypothetical protein
MRGGVTSWWCEVGETCNFGIRALDPDAVPDSERLKEIVTTVYRRWGLRPTFW